MVLQNQQIIFKKIISKIKKYIIKEQYKNSKYYMAGNSKTWQVYPLERFIQKTK